MKSVKLTEAVTYSGEIVEAGQILMLGTISAQALVSEGKAIFVELEDQEN